MPCRNSECERNTLTDNEQLVATIDMLRRLRISDEVAASLGSCSGCMLCSCHKVASWLEELLDRRETEYAGDTSDYS